MRKTTRLSLENIKILNNRRSFLNVIMKNFLFTCYILSSVREQAQSRIFVTVAAQQTQHLHKWQNLHKCFECIHLKAGLFSLQQCLYFYYRRQILHSPFWFTWNGLLKKPPQKNNYGCIIFIYETDLKLLELTSTVFYIH